MRAYSYRAEVKSRSSFFGQNGISSIWDDTAKYLSERSGLSSWHRDNTCSQSSQKENWLPKIPGTGATYDTSHLSASAHSFSQIKSSAG